MSYDPANDRPYHETIIGLIKQLANPDMAVKVADLIVVTACPANYDAIITAWRDLLKHLNIDDDSPFGVIAAMEIKKVAAEARAAEEATRRHPVFDFRVQYQKP